MSGLTRIQRFDREYFPTIANNSTDADHDLDIGAARIWVSNGTDELLIDFAALIKRIDAAWAAGTNEGGLDTGTVGNNTWYYIWAIYNPSTNVADYLLSASATSPTLPSGYTYLRRIAAAVLTDGSANIRAFVKVGDFFWLTTAITDFSSITLETTATSISVSVPNFACRALVRISAVGTTVPNNAILFSSNQIVAIERLQVSGAVIGGSYWAVPTTNQQIRYSVADNTGWTSFAIVTAGFEVY